ncbi:MAG: hypothetical protein QNK04_33940 [Myxococcota bacterium]|nr:hypothetical protein [Myxococcota bacterium]
MDVPSIKGSTLEALVADVNRLVERGRLTREQLEAQLQHPDLELLEEKLQAASWYPVESYRRLSELLLEVEGRCDVSYLRRRGERVAERLFESGLYAQLRRGDQIAGRGEDGVAAEAEGFTERDGRLITSLSGAIFNFSVWTFRAGPMRGDWVVEVTEAEALPEVARHAAQGFIQYAARRISPQRAPVVSSERVAPDRVVFTIDGVA